MGPHYLFIYTIETLYGLVLEDTHDMEYIDEHNNQDATSLGDLMGSLKWFGVGFACLYFLYYATYYYYIPYNSSCITLALGHYFSMMNSGAIDPELAMAKLEAINYIVGLLEQNWSVLKNQPWCVCEVAHVINDMVYVDKSCDLEYLEKSKVKVFKAIHRRWFE